MEVHRLINSGPDFTSEFASRGPSWFPVVGQFEFLDRDTRVKTQTEPLRAPPGFAFRFSDRVTRKHDFLFLPAKSYERVTTSRPVPPHNDATLTRTGAPHEEDRSHFRPHRRPHHLRPYGRLASPREQDRPR